MTPRDLTPGEQAEAAQKMEQVIVGLAANTEAERGFAGLAPMAGSEDYDAIMYGSRNGRGRSDGARGVSGRADGSEGEDGQPDTARDAKELDRLLAEEDQPYDWLVPGLWERADRVILTGGEGEGKSTLLRQIGLRCAAGMHPFADRPIDPVRVLIIDLENSERQVKRAIRGLRAKAKTYQPTPGLYIHCVPGGIDLRDPVDRAEFIRVIGEVKPDLLITGPLYKLSSTDGSDWEGPARVTTGWLDKIRSHFNCAMLLEAHTPHENGGGARPKRPFGASLWKRWPEFGVHLSKTGVLTHWRPPRDEREWPTGLRRGGDWPWTATYRQEVEGDQPKPFRPTVLMERLSRELEHATRQPGQNELISLIPGRRQYKIEALTTLVDEGFVLRASKGQTQIHKSLKPYRESQDPESDVYQPPLTPTGSAGSQPVPTGSSGTSRPGSQTGSAGSPPFRGTGNREPVEPPEQPATASGSSSVSWDDRNDSPATSADAVPVAPVAASDTAVGRPAIGPADALVGSDCQHPGCGDARVPGELFCDQHKEGDY
jgi:hypothetical protein